jgi:hypothetical protein
VVENCGVERGKLKEEEAIYFRGSAEVGKEQMSAEA